MARRMAIALHLDKNNATENGDPPRPLLCVLRILAVSIPLALPDDVRRKEATSAHRYWLLLWLPITTMFASGYSSRPAAAATKVSHVRFVEPSHSRRATNRLDDPSSSSSSDSDDDSLDEEERLDRELSRRHGEAVEARTNKKRSGGDENDQEDLDALYQNAKKKAKAKRVPDLTVESLTGTEGLIRIQTDFFRRDHLPSIPSKASSIASSSQFALAIVEAYKSFCFHLMPNVAFEDALLKIERFGSKRPVRKYLDEMRQNARNRHVETALGEDRAARVLQELHDAILQQEQNHMFDGNDEHEEPTVDASAPAEPAGNHGDGDPQAAEERAAGADGAGNGLSASGSALSRQPAVTPAGYDDDNQEDEHEATFADDNGDDADGTEDAQYDTVSALLGTSSGSPIASPVAPPRRPTSRRRVFDDDDDDDDDTDDIENEEGENESRHKNVAASTTSTIRIESSSVDPPRTAAAASASRRRFVLRDDDDDEDDEEDEVESSTETALGVSVDMNSESASTPNSPMKDGSRVDEPPKEADAQESSPPTRPSAALLLPLAQDSPLEASASPTSSSSTSSAPTSPDGSSPSTSPTSPSRPAPSSGGIDPRLDVENHDEDDRDMENLDEDDEDEETATVIPSALTGPTQWTEEFDDEDED